MKHGGKMLVCLLGSFGLCTAANGITETPGIPYEDIITRNVFALKPPPAPPNPEDTKPPPLKITLTGITTVVGKRALMETPGPQPKPGQAASPKQFYMLGEGQREGPIEVVQIDEKAGSVKVRNSGQELTLTFEKDGAKLPATQPPPAVPGIPGALPGVPSPTGVMPPPMKTADASVPAGFTMPNRIPRVASYGTGLSPGLAGVPATGGFAGSGVPVNAGAGAVPGSAGAPGGISLSSLMSSGTPPSQMQKYPPEVALSREEQVLMIEAQRELLRSQGSAAANLLPSTPATPGSGNNNSSSQNTTTPGLPIPGGPPGFQGGPPQIPH